MPRVYISPSTQQANIGVGSYGSEEMRMNQVADRLIPILQAHGVTCFRNKPEMTHITSKDESNRIGVDAHVAIHSDAGGGRGTSAYTSGSVKGKKLTQAIYDEVARISPSPDRGVRITADLTEVIKTTAPACLVEVSYHDFAPDAAWILDSITDIAIAIAKGILKYFDIVYQTEESRSFPTQPFNPPPPGYIWKLVPINP